MVPIGLPGLWLARPSYLEQDDHGEEHVEAPQGWGQEAAIGIWHIKGRMFFKGFIPETVT